jgi:hypothetical protein
MTSATKLTKKGSSAAGKSATRAGSPDFLLDEAATMPQGTFNDRDENFMGDASMMKSAIDDDEEEAEKEAERAKQRPDSPNTLRLKECYKDAKGETIDPKKKFGIIEDNVWLYDNITTSYPLNLPTDYYQKYINTTMPTKESGNGKWFIRPHHLETLTKHPLSVKDDVLNTRYYSHYNQDYGKIPKRNDNAEAIEYIENHLKELKSNQHVMMLKQGMDPE